MAAALSQHSIALTTHADTEKNEPPALRRRDGASVYTRHDSTVYTSADILAAERRILAAAGLRTVAQSMTPASVWRCWNTQANQDLELNAGQVALVREMATSGARVQLALAPAGTGKTTAMATLAAAWRNAGGNVIGLAPSAGAAEVLAEDLGAPTDTIAKLVQLTETRGGQPAPADDPARQWFDTIDSGTLLIVDEAGMASTLDLDTVIAHALARGASVRLIGDDQQLASISAGGILRDLADRHETVTLSTVVRFTHPETGPAEAAASLAIRAGDPAGIGFYIDHHRVHVGADATAADMAYQAWAADIAAGRDSILLAPTNDLVAQLNERARLDRLAHTTTTTATPASAATVTLADGLTASAGDWIATRKNARWLRTTQRGTWVKNGHRWIIRTVHDDGSLTVVPLRGRATPVRLPARYVSTYTTLGYASTINAAQGMTAGGRDIEGTCHTVISDRLNPPTALRRRHPRAHRKPLLRFHRRSRPAPHSGAQSHPPAHRRRHPLRDPFPRRSPTLRPQRRGRRSRPVHPPAPCRRHVRRRPDRRRRTTRRHRGHVPYRRRRNGPGSTRHRSSSMARVAPQPCPVGHRRTRPRDRPARRGRPPRSATPTTPPPCSTGAYPLPRRQAQSNVGPLRWLPATPDVLAAHPQWGPYLHQRAQLVAELADQVRDTARAWDPSTAPTWARPLRRSAQRTDGRNRRLPRRP